MKQGWEGRVTSSAEETIELGKSLSEFIEKGQMMFGNVDQELTQNVVLSGRRNDHKHHEFKGFWMFWPPPMGSILGSIFSPSPPWI